MQPSTINSLKKFVNRAILLGVIGAAIVFLFTIYLPKQYLVVGKLVVFPASSASAQKNLGYEVGNTVEILNSLAFKINTFQGMTGNFAYAKQLDASSVIKIAFYAQRGEETAVEDSIARIPMALADYSRDLYGGSPFKYKLLSDPEVSVNPVKPNLAEYLSWGFAAGVLIYFLYWFLFEFLRVPLEKQKTSTENLKAVEVAREELESTASKAEKADVGTVEIGKEKPVSKPAKVIEPMIKEVSSSLKSTVPENLPFAEEETPTPPVSEEPTDEEVKDRLNRLMRGEL